MPRVNVYLPDDLADGARRAGLNVSALVQDAIRQALGAQETNRWLTGLPKESAHAVSHELTLQALDAARDEAPTRHA
ncbi:type II toxin-antitoxin system CcdA family antitoxin [uncultured Amnibacterium sp.]|uniref:type II toxin-antitoxin system CcdA family antitoxin n=1 Tax=uncultured Amnibacterium sp. TaxID=1631851 RepID=UPI0035CCA3B8